MKIIIVGGGDVGKTVANVLAAKDHDITIIEIDEAKAKNIASISDSLVLKGDATDMEIMKDANLDTADVIIAVTNDDKTNLMVCQIAKSSNVKKIITRVNDPKNDALFTKLGIKNIISTVSSQVTEIKKALYKVGEERIIAVLNAGDVQIVELNVDKNAPLSNIKVSDFEYGIIGAIYRNGKMIIPKPDTKVKPGDVLTIVLESKDINNLSKFKK
jgi:trk system potassium uptake protein TrkA